MLYCSLQVQEIPGLEDYSKALCILKNCSLEDEYSIGININDNYHY